MANEKLTIRQIADRCLDESGNDWRTAEMNMQRQAVEALDVREAWVIELLRPYLVQVVRRQFRKAAKARGIGIKPVVALEKDHVDGTRGVTAMYKQAMDARRIEQEAKAERAAENDRRKVARQAVAKAEHVVKVRRSKTKS
jgi:hypothetical protein